MASEWTPPPGRHQVNMGGSMTRFLKQRRGIQQSKQPKVMPTNSYYHFKYNFIPESVDSTKPGVIELTQGGGTTNVRVERASIQPDKVVTFHGKEEPSKEVECVLIYDEESGIFTLEKLDSALMLRHERTGPSVVRPPSPSPLPTPSPSASATKTIDNDDLTDELNREIENTFAAASENEVDDKVPLSAATTKLHKAAPGTRNLKSSAQAPLASKPPNGKQRMLPHGTGKEKSKPSQPSPLSHSVHPAPAAKSKGSDSQVKSSLAHPTSSSVPSSRAAGKGKLPADTTSHSHSHTIDVEEEVLEFGKPARQAIRKRTSPSLSSQPRPSTSTPAPVSSLGLALPTANGPNALAPQLPGYSSVASHHHQQEDEEDDEEWDEVTADSAGPSPSIALYSIGDVGDTGAGEGADEEEEGEEINIDQFAADVDRELQQGMLEEEGRGGDAEDEGDDIFGDGEIAAELAAATAGARAGGPATGPISLHKFAGGVEDDVDDDDYSSSSEDSDDD